MTEILSPLDLAEPADDDRTARAASLRSRRHTHGRDGDAWVALFAEEGVVCDPVGPSPFDETGEGHRGHAAIRTFWDTVIAPNPVRLDILLSNTASDGREVANVIAITTTLPDGSTAATEMVACYRVDDDGKITSLRAFWEFDKLRFTPAPS
ncbi:MAG: hypothetical protein JWM89_3102 [Acidimicrobiales bacterium]|nr:hypothetical protein [Acidimicrobiales bacterium]